MSETTKGGNVILRNVRVPDTVEPGETFTAEADVDVGGVFVNPLDPDHCNNASGAGAGYTLSVEFEGPDGTVKEAGPTCQLMTEVGENRSTYSKDFTAPMYDEQATVSARVVMRDSGKSTDEMSDTAEVSRDAPTEPENPDYTDGGSTGDNVNWNPPDPDDSDGPQFPDFGIGDKLEGVGLLVVVLIGVYLLVEMTEAGVEGASPL
ncbi:hypothetical protein [Halosimplex amylolyticum]|uniref:hypothetical protein n=1 Tax=Halosimplex amylolyticum TaxID=3396616 RepID=UPI003F562C29